MRKRKCKHENVRRGWLVLMPDGVKKCDVHRCEDCNEWLPLGPATDDERTAIEVRAALLADVCERTGLPPQWIEYDGWQGHRYDTDFYSGEPIQHRRHWEAGYLARCIATHEEHQ